MRKNPCDAISATRIAFKRSSRVANSVNADLASSTPHPVEDIEEDAEWEEKLAEAGAKSF